MVFEPTTCSDCSYPPNFTVLDIKTKNGDIYFFVKCRDCGDSWKESADPIFSENFFEIIQDDDEE